MAGVDIIVFRKQNQGAFGSDQEGDLFDTIVTKSEQTATKVILNSASKGSKLTGAMINCADAEHARKVKAWRWHTA